jgi:hypothetical protein
MDLLAEIATNMINILAYNEECQHWSTDGLNK